MKRELPTKTRRALHRANRVLTHGGRRACDSAVAISQTLRNTSGWIMVVEKRYVC